MKSGKGNPKKIVIVAATKIEIKPLIEFLQVRYNSDQSYQFDLSDRVVHLLITGVGSIQMAVNTALYYYSQKPDLALLAGIGGSYNRDIEIGETCLIVSEQFGDLGVEENSGDFTNVFETGLISPGQLPFSGGKLLMQSIPDKPFLRHANGLTVNMVSGSKQTIKMRTEKFDADIESMEGAAFFYSSLICKIPFLQIRTISNYVEPRNPRKWEIEKAVLQLNQVLREIIHIL